ncbi:hypothetical protein ACQV5M_13180 [Leptospira sp. SA-E8]|uniref:hypothetical protein n=1 Tax=Leptospira sp. SA-E8 TaxID=3422259 RepID=UPI003EB7AAD9
MGTSQSSKGPTSGTPLVPPWADDRNRSPLPVPAEAARFRSFRKAISTFASSGNTTKLRQAIGHYARTASGGSAIAARRMGSVTQAGGALFSALKGSSDTSSEVTINIDELSGLPCEAAISSITNALLTEDGDSDKIRIAMNHALSEALDGVEIFDVKHITDEVIINTMINYLSECIFLHIVSEAGKSWNYSDSVSQAIKAEIDLRELVKVIVDKHLAQKFSGNIQSLTNTQIVKIQRQAVIDVWKEWESYK